jgi:hypothetical protein
VKLGDRKGHLLVVVEPIRIGRRLIAEVRCGCGKQWAMRADMWNRASTSGCYVCANTKHGQAGGIGKRRTRTYRTWCGMIRRCEVPHDRNWRRYGGRGITICPEWRESFDRFVQDMGERPPGRTIDRIDNDRGYEPSNCRWATPTEQQRNRSCSKHVRSPDAPTEEAASTGRVQGAEARDRDSADKP